MECSDEECIEYNVSQPASQNHYPAIQESSPNHQWMTSQATGQLPHSQLPNQTIVLNQQLPNQLIGQLAQQPSQTDHQIIELSVKFGEWFYSVLPEIERGGVFAVNNFWEDSLMGVEFEYNTKTITLSECNASRNVELLRKLIASNLRFKPNLLPQHDGVQAHMDPHGLLKTAINGTLFAGDEPVGWFEHLFGLIAENSLHEDRWRIKMLQMKLKLSKPLLTLQGFIDEHTNSIEG